MSAIEPLPIGASRVTPWSPVSDRKIYVLWIALVWVGMLGGFGLDFTRYLGETPGPPFILHFHAAALVDQARQVGHPDYAPQFLALTPAKELSTIDS